MTDLQTKIDDKRVEGWSLHAEQGDRAVMVKRHYGGIGGHVLIALLTLWWTLGLGNIAYAAYHYFGRPDKIVVRDDGTDADTDE